LVRKIWFLEFSCL